jgi:hypothetical protein
MTKQDIKYFLIRSGLSISPDLGSRYLKPEKRLLFYINDKKYNNIGIQKSPETGLIKNR